MNARLRTPHDPWTPAPPTGGADVGAPPPPAETGGGRGRGGGPRPPRRPVIAFVWLGAGVIAAERLSMLVFTSPDQPLAAYVAAAIVFGTVVLGGLVVGGALFWRAWQADRAPRGRG